MNPSAPLSGVHVLEFGTFVTGSYTAGLLGDMGADVIKVERPPRGDPMRAWDNTGRSPYFRAYNKSKRSVVLDLRSEKGLEACHRLIATADVLVHNYRPSVADRLGIGAGTAREINPRLVYCQISGFGDSGPYAARPSYNQVVQSLSGLDSLITDPASPSPACRISLTLSPRCMRAMASSRRWCAGREVGRGRSSIPRCCRRWPRSCQRTSRITS